MGEEGYMTALYDEPALMHELQRVLPELRHGLLVADPGPRSDIDWVVILEDVAYRGGPMISRAMFEDLRDALHRAPRGLPAPVRVPAVMVDCDGRLDGLLAAVGQGRGHGTVPDRGGERHPGHAREAYPRLQLLGGVDKRPLITGRREAIDTELARIAPLLERGGFIPHIDHAVPEDIAWDSFRYYRERLNEIIDRRKG